MPASATARAALLVAAAACQMSVSSASAFTTIDRLAGFTFGTNVTEHALIDLDVAEMESLADAADFAGAKTIYTTGKHSKKSSGSFRTVQGFSTSFDKLKEQPVWKLYKSYYASDTYADDLVLAALDGTGDYAGLTDVERGEIAVKTAQNMNVWYYVVHEMEDAIGDCEADSATRNDAPVHAWDEAWAFYAGSLEEDFGQGSGKLTFALAEKRCAGFETCVGASTNAKVNTELLGLFATGQSLLRKGDCTEMKLIKERIVELMTIPLIQGALRYAYRADPKSGYAGSTTDGKKERAEGWAFAAAVLPLVNNCSTSAAETIERNLGYSESTAVKDGKDTVLRAFQEVYTCMGLTCADIGGEPNEDGTGYVLEACSDNSGLSGGQIAGVIIAVGLGAVALFAGATFYMKSRKGIKESQTVGLSA